MYEIWPVVGKGFSSDGFRSAQPTNQPTENLRNPRVTTAHANWDKIEKCLEDEKWYISYAENGSDGGNPHFHVLLPGSVSKDRERI